MKNYHPTNPNTLLGSEPFVSYYARNPQKEFDRIQKLTEETKGIVMPYLNDSYVEILQVEQHDFKSDKPLVEAQLWAENNLIRTYTSHKGTLNEFSYSISKKSIKKYLDPSATNKSDSINVHLSVLKVLPQIINASIEVEIHADYTKINGVRSVVNSINENILIHRFYGVILFLHKVYRIKTTIYEYRNLEFPNKPYSFEVIKIELLDESNSSIMAPNHPNSQRGLIIRVANILQNVEKSYDKGKLLLEESKKSDAWDAIFRRF